MLARTGSFSSGVNPLAARQATGANSESNVGSTHSLPRQGSLQRQQQTAVTRQGSDGSASNGVVRQGSQGSIFEQIASQAKDLVRETTRQSSQDGLLAHMDKV